MRKITHKFIIILIPFLFGTGSLHAQFVTLDWKMHDVGKVRQLITNMGTWDESNEDRYTNYPGLLFAEMPAGSNEEHIYQGGIWIGGITPEGDTLVSVTRTHFTPSEFFPTDQPWDTVWVVSKPDSAAIPYWPGTYKAVSNQDLVCRYSDYNIQNIENHTPLFLDVIQRSYAWSSEPLDEFIVYNYDIIPTKFELHDVFVGFWLHGEVGDNDAAYNFIDEVTLFYPDNQLAIAEDTEGGDDGNTISPIGIKILEPTDSSLIWTFKWYNHEDLGGFGRDATRYRIAMNSGEIMQNRTEPERAHISVCFGPYSQVLVGDTLHFELAEVFGFGREKLLENAEYLEILREIEYRIPSPPPRPPLRVKKIESQQVTLSWKPEQGDRNPELYEDPYRSDEADQPFEGYRVYKSTESINGPWTLLAEYDIPGNEFGPNNPEGLQYEYTDTGLLNNFEYFYTVSAYSKPDTVGGFPSQESSVNANALRIIPGPAPPATVGQVAVVPNPYRGDEAYHEYNPKWEVPGGDRGYWLEQDRRIQFINLPVRCEIKIYTLSGDLVNTLRHDNPNQGFEDWNLTSSVGQAISSGIYLFTVEDLKTGKVQVGKFVIIK